MRQGSSVRGAIDVTLVAGQLLDLAGVDRDPATTKRYPEIVYRRHGGGAVGPDLPGRDRRRHARGGAAADLGGPLPPGPGGGRAWLKSRRRRTRRPVGHPAQARPATQRLAQPLQPAQPKVLDEQPRLLRPAGRRSRRPRAERSRGRRPQARGRAGQRQPGRDGGAGTLLAAVPDDGQPDPEAVTARSPDRRSGWPCRGRGATPPPAAGVGSWPASGTAAALTTSTWTPPSTSSSSIRCPRRTTSSCGSGCAPGAASSCWSTCPARCAGERVRTAAATVGALAAELARDDLAVVAFWSDAAVLGAPGSAGSRRQCSSSSCCASRPGG